MERGSRFQGAWGECNVPDKVRHNQMEPARDESTRVATIVYRLSCEARCKEGLVLRVEDGDSGWSGLEQTERRNAGGNGVWLARSWGRLLLTSAKRRREPGLLRSSSLAQ